MKLERFEGCWTAMITPFDRKGKSTGRALPETLNSRSRMELTSSPRGPRANLRPWIGGNTIG